MYATTSLLPCPSCGRNVSSRAKTCPGCGDPLSARGTTKSFREVSVLWTFLFGCFYFMFKGWFKAAIGSLALVVLTAGFAWLFIPLFAQKFVDSIEG